MKNIQEIYQNKIISHFKKDLGYTNDLEVPRIEKIIVNTGVGKKVIEDPKFLEIAISDLSQICGQKPKVVKSKKAISGFKLKKGAPTGLVVTLRRKRMFDFLEKLINIVLPRIRDFRGLKKGAVDNFGNLNIGISDMTVFPEIKPDQVIKSFSLQINIVTTAKNSKNAKELLKSYGFIFQE